MSDAKQKSPQRRPSVHGQSTDKQSSILLRALGRGSAPDSALPLADVPRIRLHVARLARQQTAYVLRGNLTQQPPYQPRSLEAPPTLRGGVVGLEGTTSYAYRIPHSEEASSARRRRQPIAKRPHFAEASSTRKRRQPRGTEFPRSAGASSAQKRRQPTLTRPHSAEASSTQGRRQPRGNEFPHIAGASSARRRRQPTLASPALRGSVVSLEATTAF